VLSKINNKTDPIEFVLVVHYQVKMGGSTIGKDLFLQIGLSIM
jgi:hypothetical protein